MQEVSGAWRSHACSDLFVQLGFLSGQWRCLHWITRAHRLYAPFRQHVKFNRVHNCEYHWGYTCIPWSHTRVPNITFLHRAQIPQAIFYLRVVQDDSIFVNSETRIAQSFFPSTKIPEALIVFEFFKATRKQSVSLMKYFSHNDHIIYKYHKFVNKT